MAHDFTICAGTIGSGVWFSSDGGERWRPSRMHVPMHAEPGEIQIRALALSPHDPHVVYAGSDAGLYRSQDNGATFELVPSPLDGTLIWSVAVHPEEPETIFVGTKPPGVWRTRDGGRNWEKLPVPMADRCMAGPPKVTNIVFDPRDPRRIWVGVEIDGIAVSHDGGDSWRHLPALGPDVLNQDVHGVALCAGREVKLLVTTPNGLWSSVDEGQSYALHEFPKFAERDPVSYCRQVVLKPDDPETIFVANGNVIPGRIGAVQCSRDGGASWSRCALPVEPNSVMYALAANPANPEVVAAASLFGYLYLSIDAGVSWVKLHRELGEIRALAWLPN